MTQKIPTPKQLMWPVLEAIRALGGSAKISEINEKVVEAEAFTEEQQDVLHKPDSSRPGSEIEYRIAWARTSLKQAGCVDNSTRGVWALTKFGQSVTEDKMDAA